VGSYSLAFVSIIYSFTSPLSSGKKTIHRKSPEIDDFTVDTNFLKCCKGSFKDAVFLP
jgi:hypothetical protein